MEEEVNILLIYMNLIVLEMRADWLTVIMKCILIFIVIILIMLVLFVMVSLNH